MRDVDEGRWDAGQVFVKAAAACPSCRIRTRRLSGEFRARRLPGMRLKGYNDYRGSTMPIFSAIAFSSLIAASVSALFAARGKHQLYWISAIGIYIFSFVAGFSIGQLTVALAFVPLALAIGYSFGWITNKTQRAIFACAGALIGLLMAAYAGSALFYPLFLLFL